MPSPWFIAHVDRYVTPFIFQYLALLFVIDFSRFTTPKPLYFTTLLPKFKLPLRTLYQSYPQTLPRARKNKPNGKFPQITPNNRVHRRVPFERISSEFCLTYIFELHPYIWFHKVVLTLLFVCPRVCPILYQLSFILARRFPKALSSISKLAKFWNREISFKDQNFVQLVSNPRSEMKDSTSFLRS